MTKATTHNQKVQKTISYACPICGLNGHKMIDCPKFVEMQKMFQGKNKIIIIISNECPSIKMNDNA